MPSEKEYYEVVDELSRFLLEMMVLAKPPEVPGRFASVDSLQTLHAHLVSLREFLCGASSGDLSRQVPLKGYVGGQLKTLQANLKHMTWQTQMVASGDLTQRVDFMGEFSESFNAMVAQLDRTLKDLVSSKADLAKVNEDLLKEIAVRKHTEAALRRSEATLRRLAMTDPLTGLYNRRYFNRLAEDEIARALRYSRPLSVMTFDIDFFKDVNDTFGHTVGDMVLKMVATATRETLRTTDSPARYGGDEFVVLLPETSSGEAAAVAERMRKRIKEAVVETEKGPIMITGSFGISDYLRETTVEPDERVLSEFLANADRALYVSKNAGRNRVTVFQPEKESSQ